MDWKLFLTTFATLFVAELGDKTQLACVAIAADSRDPWTVFAGSALALVLVSFIGVMAAEALCRIIDPGLMKKIAAAGFVVMGGLIWFDKL